KVFSMKSIANISILFSLSLLFCGNSLAQSSGSEGNPNSGDLYWYCESLGVVVPPPQVPHRTSFCFSYSPDETLDQLEFRINIQGQSKIPPSCTVTANYNITSDLEGYDHI